MSTDKDNTKKLFSGLEKLGFSDLNVDLYKNEEKEKLTQLKLKERGNSYLYERTVKCPVCDAEFKCPSVKTSAPRVLKRDSDFFIIYGNINPYFYDVWICNSCGYAALKVDFLKIKEFQKELIFKNITSKWRGRDYQVPYDENIAIERYKLALLNAVVTNCKDSTKAMLCLKIAWMYRLKEMPHDEIIFIEKSLEGFVNAFEKESFPIYGMDKFTTMYLFGELNRRLGNTEESLNWLGKVITTTGVSSRLKELARDQKDLIKNIDLN